MFRGLSYHTIDTKGRIIVPARFREMIKSGDRPGVIITKLDGGLVAYTDETWTQIESKIMSQAIKSEAMRRFRRIFIGGAFPCHCDKQDRVLVPPTLREYAHLEKEIVLVGVLDHFEIWSKQYWERENTELEKNMQQEEVRNEIATLGL